MALNTIEETQKTFCNFFHYKSICFYNFHLVQLLQKRKQGLRQWKHTFRVLSQSESMMVMIHSYLVKVMKMYTFFGTLTNTWSRILQRCQNFLKNPIWARTNPIQSNNYFLLNNAKLYN